MTFTPRPLAECEGEREVVLWSSATASTAISSSSTSPSRGARRIEVAPREGLAGPELGRARDPAPRRTPRRAAGSPRTARRAGSRCSSSAGARPGRRSPRARAGASAPGRCSRSRRRRSKPATWSMCAWLTKTWLTRRSSRGESGPRSPRSKSIARRSKRKSRWTAGSPKGPLTSLGPHESAHGMSKGAPPEEFHAPRVRRGRLDIRARRGDTAPARAAARGRRPPGRGAARRGSDAEPDRRRARRGASLGPRGDVRGRAGPGRGGRRPWMATRPGRSP